MANSHLSTCVSLRSFSATAERRTYKLSRNSIWASEQFLAKWIFMWQVPLVILTNSVLVVNFARFKSTIPVIRFHVISSGTHPLHHVLSTSDFH